MTGEELTIIACGMPVHGALEAARALNAQGRSVGVIDMASIKPIDRDAILAAAARTRKMMTVEEHNVLGGLGAAVAEVLTDEGAGVKLKRHGIYDEYSLIAPPAHLYAHYKLDGPGIAEVAEVFLNR
jgi:transketolase